MTDTVDEIIYALAAPFPPHKIHWRIGSTNKDKTKGVALAYLNARDVMQRLDDVVGATRWSDSYVETSAGRIICKLSLAFDSPIEGEWPDWIHKSDGAGDTAFEGAKGAISDAFKRAAVKWGIGRSLYDCEAPWVTLKNNKYLPDDFDGSKYLPKPGAFKTKQMKTKVWNSLRDAAAEGNAPMARETWDELNNDQQSEVWRELSSGQRATIKLLLKETT